MSSSLRIVHTRFQSTHQVVDEFLESSVVVLYRGRFRRAESHVQLTRCFVDREVSKQITHCQKYGIGFDVPVQSLGRLLIILLVNDVGPLGDTSESNLS